MIDVELVLDAHELASRFGSSRPQLVYDWRSRHDDFPPPVLAKHGLSLWYWPDVEAWAQATGRLPAR